MTNSDSPAGPTGGPVTLSGLDDLPEKLRVHALAKLLGRTSREVMAALLELGFAARSVQSSVNRKTAEQVAVLLVPELAAAPAPPAEDVLLAGEQPGVVDEPAGPADEPAVLAPLFAPPAPVFQPPVRRSRRRAAEPAAEPATETATEPATETATEPAADEPVRRTRRRGQPGRAAAEAAAPGSPLDAVADQPPTDEAAGPADTDDDRADDDSDEGGARRRRRRGRRGRGRGRGGEGDGTEADSDTDADEGDADETDGADTAVEEPGAVADETDDEAGASRRRRRRRRRRGSGDDPSADDESDPPHTVVKVRAPRERPDDADGDGVQSVRGSTRLEAKRQRRRDGRDAGRRRVPILSEAEFLARRESVERSMVVRERGDRVEIGVLEDHVLVEHFVTNGAGGSGSATNSLVGNIYLGRVQNVLPSMEAAFVDIGRGRNAVLYAGEVDWDAAGLGGRARRIEQALSSGDSVLVQVTKDPVGHKGARLTTQISLAGRFLVYVPSGGAAGISRKLPDIERKRLKDLLREIVPSEAGVIIRTASEGVTQEALERDVRRLQAQWEVVKEKAEKTGPNRPKAPVLLYEEPDMLIKVVRDQFNEDFSRLVIAGDDAWETVANYVGHVAPELTGRLHRHIGPRDVFEEYRIDEQLLKALDRKVWLPSGGTLVIDRTEAMTVIDVNTGKFTGSGGNLEETVTRNNLEAAEEIVRQLRLRDIGGIIVIDFIDMVLEANRDLVLRRLTECLARDRTRHQVAEVTSLGLVQMTRKRVGGGLLEHFSTPCEHCRGRGVIVATGPVTEPNGRDRGERERNGDTGGRRGRGRGRRDEANGDRGRRLPAALVPDLSALAPAASEEASPAAPDETVPDETVPDEAGPDEAGPDEAGHGQVVPVEPDRGEAGSDVGAPEPVEPEPTASAVVPATVETVRDDVEEIVVEQALAAERDRRSAPNGRIDTATPGLPTAESGTNGAVTPGSETVDRPEPVGRRRRGRVTRTVGAPTVTTGDAPTVGVVTVPSARPAGEHAEEPGAGAAATPPAPEPVVAPRARRARRAASRPAGPPAPDAATPGDPV
ncbi:MAG: translation initiation factor IF-2 N-terminal domain-containing protein [Pseudonocardia sp.]|nr:translation initiation factor IF-2 N-terminal domain-containing protein [Pseudonocardia sp.]